MTISIYKKRYNVTLTPEIVDQFQKLIRLHGLPPSFMSFACQSGIETFSEVLELSKNDGTITQSDIFMLLAKRTNKIVNVEAKIMPSSVSKKKAKNI